MVGNLHFKSGRTIRHKLSGTYKGSSGYLGDYTVDDVTSGDPTQVKTGPTYMNQTL